MSTVDIDPSAHAHLAPSMDARHEWQSYSELAEKLELPANVLEVMQARYANGTETAYALETREQDDVLQVRVRPEYSWMPQQNMVYALGLPTHGGGFSSRWTYHEAGVRRVGELLIARRRCSRDGSWEYALVDPAYQVAPRTTPAKGIFLMIHEHQGGRKGQVVVYQNHFDNSIFWGWWGPGFEDTREDVLAEARRIKRALTGSTRDLAGLRSRRQTTRSSVPSTALAS